MALRRNYDWVMLLGLLPQNGTTQYTLQKTLNKTEEGYSLLRLLPQRGTTHHHAEGCVADHLGL